jgi:hypothetical protein
MDHKELRTNSYEVNSNYKRHTGPGIRFRQKSRSWDSDHHRDWRKRCKKEIIKVKRKNTNEDIKNNTFKCKDKLKKSKNTHIYF